MGFPIGIDSGRGSPQRIVWQQVNVVFSVGPYPLIIDVLPACLRKSRTWREDKTSPPARSWLRVRSPSGCSSTIKWKIAAVSHSVVTQCLRTARTKSCSDEDSGGISTTQLPLRRAPHISKVDASN